MKSMWGSRKMPQRFGRCPFEVVVSLTTAGWVRKR